MYISVQHFFLSLSWNMNRFAEPTFLSIRIEKSKLQKMQIGVWIVFVRWEAFANYSRIQNISFFSLFLFVYAPSKVWFCQRFCKYSILKHICMNNNNKKKTLANWNNIFEVIMCGIGVEYQQIDSWPIYLLIICKRRTIP